MSSHDQPGRFQNHNQPVLFRRLAVIALAGSLASAATTAFVDAATISNRLDSDVIDQRPLWLHTYSVALLTCAVAVIALAGLPLARTRAARVVYLLIAAMNLSVPFLGSQHEGARLLIPVVHVVVAMVLAAMAAFAPTPALNSEADDPGGDPGGGQEGGAATPMDEDQL